MYADMAVSPSSGGPILRCWSYTDYDPLPSARAFFNEEIHKQYDKNVAECSFTGLLGCNLLRGYQCGFRILTVAARDVEQIGFIQPERDGSVKVCLWGDEE